MDQSLRELIQLVTKSGTLSSEHENLLKDKAKALGISEVELFVYINAALEKSGSLQESNTKDSAHNPLSPISSVAPFELNVKKLSIRDIISLAGAFLIFIAGFFPWIKSYAGGSFGTFSTGASGSYSFGFFYTFPLAASAFIFIFMKKLRQYQLFEGIGLILTAIAFLVSYSSNYNFSSSSEVRSYAGTSAGSGVRILLAGGIIYTFGSLYEIIPKRVYLLIGTIALVLLQYLPILVWNDRSSGYNGIKNIFLPSIFFIGFFIANKLRKTGGWDLSFKWVYLVILIDFLLRSLSFFPTSDASGISNGFRFSNNAWFVNTYFPSGSEDSFYGAINFMYSLQGVLNKVIYFLLWLLVIPGLFAATNGFAEYLNIPVLRTQLDEISRQFFQKVQIIKFKSQSFTSNFMSVHLILLSIFVALRLVFAFGVNFTLYQGIPNTNTASNTQIDTKEEIGETKAEEPTPAPVTDLSQPKALLYQQFINSGTNSATRLIDGFYPIGWSQDGKLAYLEEPADEACGCYLLNFYIQDLQTDKIVWKWNYQSDGQEKVTLTDIWSKNSTLFDNKLSEFGIEPYDYFRIEQLPLEFNGNEYSISIKNEGITESGYVEENAIASSSVFLFMNGRKVKRIYNRKYISRENEGGNYSGRLSNSVVGYVKNPFEDRIAVLFVTEHRGYEGPPNHFKLEIIGCKLDN